MDPPSVDRTCRGASAASETNFWNLPSQDAIGRLPSSTNQFHCLNQNPVTLSTYRTRDTVIGSYLSKLGGSKLPSEKVSGSLRSLVLLLSSPLNPVAKTRTNAGSAPFSSVQLLLALLLTCLANGLQLVGARTQDLVTASDPVSSDVRRGELRWKSSGVGGGNGGAGYFSHTDAHALDLRWVQMCIYPIGLHFTILSEGG